MENEDSVSSLAERCQRVGYIIKTAAEGEALEGDDRMLQAIDNLQRCVLAALLLWRSLPDILPSLINQTLRAMEKKSVRSKRRKLLHVFEDADEIATLDTTITQFIAEFHVSVRYSSCASLSFRGLNDCQLRVTIISDKNVRDIWQWVKVSCIVCASPRST